jgi:hypothetical protein
MERTQAWWPIPIIPAMAENIKQEEQIVVQADLAKKPDTVSKIIEKKGWKHGSSGRVPS